MSRVSRGGAQPLWMQRAIRVIFGLSVALGLVVLGLIWFEVALDGNLPSARGRVALPPMSESEYWDPGLLDAPLSYWLLWGFLGACVFATWRVERREANCFEPSIALGTLLVVVGCHAGSLGGRAWQMTDWMYRLALYDRAMLICSIGASLLLFGLARIAFDGRRRGAVIGACALMIAGQMMWYVHQMGIAPKCAQPDSYSSYLTLPIERVWSDSVGGRRRRLAMNIEVFPGAERVRVKLDGEEIELTKLTDRIRARADALGWEKYPVEGSNRLLYEHRPMLAVDARLTFREIWPVISACESVGIWTHVVATQLEPWIYSGDLRPFVFTESYSDYDPRLEMHSTTGGAGLVLKYTCNGHWSDDPVEALALAGYGRWTVGEGFVPELALDGDATWQQVVTCLGELGRQFGLLPSISLREE